MSSSLRSFVEVSNSKSNEDIIIEDSSNNFSEHVNSPVDSYSSVNDNFSVSNNHVSPIIILVCSMKYLNSFLVEDAIITIQGNGKICVNAKQKMVFYQIHHS